MADKLKSTNVKFEFGRHATFHLREGWLSKGLSVAGEKDGFDSSLETADRLGLGSRMVKSLAFWLEATNLIEKENSKTSKGRGKNVLSDFGRIVSKRDPYFEFPITLWITHIILANRLGTVWNWFFNDFRLRTFDRETCIESFVRYLHEKASNPPVLKTCQREVNCLLALYSRPSVGIMADPEDSTVSPFKSLGLLVRNVDNGVYEKTNPIDRIPIEAFLAAISYSNQNEDEKTVRLTELISGKNSPGRIMNLGSELVNELSEQAEMKYSKLKGGGVGIDLLGSDRVMKVPIHEPGFWLQEHIKDNMGVK